MDANSMKSLISSQPYDFLSQRPELGNNIILLGLGGSHAYGTNVEGSDLDVRGIATNTRDKIYLGQQFDQSIDRETDTTIYSFDKIIRLFCSCNPNTIEMLGLKPEHYLYINDIGRLLLDNRSVFLSKRAINSFGGYANSQLRRLENKSAKTASQEREEQFILRSIECAQIDFKRKYFDMPEDAIKLYIDKSEREEYDTEIFMDVVLKHYPLRDYRDMVSEMQSIIRSYKTIGRRNANAIEHNKIAKHMMHLVRLYLMCFDILNDGEIVTYRKKDHGLLMDIRNGKYLDDNDQPTQAFYEMISGFENDLEYSKLHTDLPDHPDMAQVQKLVLKVNEAICDNDTNLKDGELSFTDWRESIGT